MALLPCGVSTFPSNNVSHRIGSCGVRPTCIYACPVRELWSKPFGTSTAGRGLDWCHHGIDTSHRANVDELRITRFQVLNTDRLAPAYGRQPAPSCKLPMGVRFGRAWVLNRAAAKFHSCPSSFGIVLDVELKSRGRPTFKNFEGGYTSSAPCIGSPPS